MYRLFTKQTEAISDRNDFDLRCNPDSTVFESQYYAWSLAKSHKLISTLRSRRASLNYTDNDNAGHEEPFAGLLSIQQILGYHTLPAALYL